MYCACYTPANCPEIIIDDKNIASLLRYHNQIQQIRRKCSTCMLMFICSIMTLGIWIWPPVMSSVAYNCPRPSDSLSLSFQSWEDTGFLGHPRILPSCPSHTTAHAVRRIPWCPLRHRPPCCPEDPLDIPILPWCPLTTQAPILSGGSPGHPGIPPMMSPQTQAPILSGGSLGHPGIPPMMSPQTQAPILSRGFLRHPGILLHVSSDTGPHAVWRIPGSYACQPFQFKTLDIGITSRIILSS